MMTDSLSLCDILIKASLKTEKRLIIDLRTVKSAYDNMVLQDVAFIQLELNIADRLTKLKKNAFLLETLSTC